MAGTSLKVEASQVGPGPYVRTHLMRVLNSRAPYFYRLQETIAKTYDKDWLIWEIRRIRTQNQIHIPTKLTTG
ncbi:hypothetical protein BXY66_1551 [Shimia isoporae]|uniref:Uncharacterized protein n=1 Tax=Shimia isoporae TaxID=647720 RepID=A0A4R1NWI7_9RHOB|nr:hypothetical protein BXY66_1551 [Shimia isoporae]